MKTTKELGLKRKLLHSRRFRMLVIGIPLAALFIVVYKFFTPSQAMAIQLMVYSIAIVFLMHNFRKSDADNIIITEQNEEINRQKIQIEEQKKLVDKAFNELHEKNKEVMDSIHCALKIQTALLTPESYFDKNLKRLQEQNS